MAFSLNAHLCFSRIDQHDYGSRTLVSGQLRNHSDGDLGAILAADFQFSCVKWLIVRP